MAGLGITLFTDEMIDPRLAVDLRRRGYDVQSCQEAGRNNRGISDQRQLSYATQQGRAILTFNRRDYRRLDRAWRAAGRPHTGIIVSGVVSDFAELLQRVKLHLDTVEPADQVDRVLLLAR
jgi:hypothetical protein